MKLAALLLCCSCSTVAGYAAGPRSGALVELNARVAPEVEVGVQVRDAAAGGHLRLVYESEPNGTAAVRHEPRARSAESASVGRQLGEEQLGASNRSDEETHQPGQDRPVLFASLGVGADHWRNYPTPWNARVDLRAGVRYRRLSAWLGVEVAPSDVSGHERAGVQGEHPPGGPAVVFGCDWRW